MRQPRRQSDERHAASHQQDLERLDGEQRLHRVEHPIERRDEQQPNGMIAIGASDSAIKGGELAFGQVLGNFEVVEGIVRIDLVDQVKQIEIDQQMPSEAGAIGQNRNEKQGERRVADRRQQGHHPVPDNQVSNADGNGGRQKSAKAERIGRRIPIQTLVEKIAENRPK